MDTEKPQVDIVEFLIAQLDADEEAAREAICKCGGPVCIPELGGMGYGELLVRMDGSERFADHYARWSVARVLADVAAKRRIIEMHRVTVQKVLQPKFDPSTGERRPAEFDVECEICGWVSGNPTSSCETVRLIAQPYKDHPSFDSAWSVPE